MKCIFKFYNLQANAVIYLLLSYSVILGRDNNTLVFFVHVENHTTGPTVAVFGGMVRYETEIKNRI